jgi:hypothetical protein
MAEQRLPGLVGEHPHIDRVRRVGAGVGMDIEQLWLGCQMGQTLLPKGLELPGVNRLVDRAPVDC